MTGRRWSDWVNHDGRVTYFDRARCAARAVWPFVACAAAVSLLVTSVIISVGAIKDRDRLSLVAENSAAAARDAKKSAAEAKAAGEGNTRLLQEIAPCDPGDPPEAPGCVRQARTDRFVADFLSRISGDLARGLAAHDANVHQSLEALRRRIGAGSAPLPTPAPITTASAPAPAEVVPPLPEPEPTTTTTTCPKLPNGKCRP